MTPLRIGVGLVALGALAAAAWTSHFGFVVLALAAGMFLATGLSRAGRLVDEFQPLVGQAVAVRVWGAEPAGTEGAILTVTSIRALGAGLHFYLRVGDSASSLHLKIAQPTGTQVTPQSLVIEHARYIQWREKRVPTVAGVAAFTVSRASHEG